MADEKKAPPITPLKFNKSRLVFYERRTAIIAAPRKTKIFADPATVKRIDPGAK